MLVPISKVPFKGRAGVRRLWATEARNVIGIAYNLQQQITAITMITGTSWKTIDLKVQHAKFSQNLNKEKGADVVDQALTFETGLMNYVSRYQQWYMSNECEMHFIVETTDGRLQYAGISLLPERDQWLTERFVVRKGTGNTGQKYNAEENKYTLTLETETAFFAPFLIDTFSLSSIPIDPADPIEIPDTTPPFIINLVPADDQTQVNISPGAVITAFFNETVQRGTGTIELRRWSDDALIQSWDITSPGVNVSTFTASTGFGLSVTLDYATRYYMIMPAGCVTDTSGNAFAGLTVKGDWDWTTRADPATAAPNLIALSPPDGTVGWDYTSTQAHIEFDVPVFAGTGFITVINYATDAIVAQIDVNDARVSFQGDEFVYLDLSTTFAAGTKYGIVVDGTAIENAMGVVWASTLITKDDWDITTTGIVDATPTIPIDDGALASASAQTLTATLSVSSVIGTGDIELRRYSDDVLIESFDITVPAEAEITGSTTLEIHVSAGSFVSGVEYYLILPVSILTGTSSEVFTGLTDKDDWNFTIAGFELTPVNPEDGSAVWIDEEDDITFTVPDDATIDAGFIRIYKRNPDGLFLIHDVSNNQITTGPQTFTWRAHGDFLQNVLDQDFVYYITTDAGIVERDADSLDLPAFDGSNGWEFVVAQKLAEINRFPAPNGITTVNVRTNQGSLPNFFLEFNQLVTLGTGFFNIHRMSDDVLVAALDVATDIQELGAGILRFEPHALLDVDTEYYILIDAGAILGTDEPARTFLGTAYGITDEFSTPTDWYFTTSPADTAPYFKDFTFGSFAGDAYIIQGEFVEATGNYFDADGDSPAAGILADHDLMWRRYDSQADITSDTDGTGGTLITQTTFTGASLNATYNVGPSDVGKFIMCWVRAQTEEAVPQVGEWQKVDTDGILIYTSEVAITYDYYDTSVAKVSFSFWEPYDVLIDDGDGGRHLFESDGVGSVTQSGDYTINTNTSGGDLTMTFYADPSAIQAFISKLQHIKGTFDMSGCDSIDGTVQISGSAQCTGFIQPSAGSWSLVANSCNLTGAIDISNCDGNVAGFSVVYLHLYNNALMTGLTLHTAASSGFTHVRIHSTAIASLDLSQIKDATYLNINGNTSMTSITWPSSTNVECTFLAIHGNTGLAGHQDLSGFTEGIGGYFACYGCTGITQFSFPTNSLKNLTAFSTFWMQNCNSINTTIDLSNFHNLAGDWLFDKLTNCTTITMPTTRNTTNNVTRVNFSQSGYTSDIDLTAFLHFKTAVNWQFNNCGSLPSVTTSAWTTGSIGFINMINASFATLSAMGFVNSSYSTASPGSNINAPIADPQTNAVNLYNNDLTTAELDKLWAYLNNQLSATGSVTIDSDPQSTGNHPTGGAANADVVAVAALGYTCLV